MARSVEPIIRALARRYDLDPDALIAVALGEGGLVNRENDIGDKAGGGSYGPFQLYAQGALPARFRGNPALADAWAWSPEGINYALSRMAMVGASGLRGPAAVETIIREFERPKNPDRSVALALSRYSQIKGTGGAAPPEGSESAGVVSSAQAAPGPAPKPGPDLDRLRQGVLLALLSDRRAGNSRMNALAALARLQRALAGSGGNHV